MMPLLMREVVRLTVPNMNGAYVMEKTLHAPLNKSFPTNFMSYPGGVESFDAYHGPINTTYSEIWWTTASDPLPPSLVSRFDGKVMAIVGMEMDQVRRTPRGDVSVPINAAYNHHHNTAIVGKGATMTVVGRDDPRSLAAGRHGRMELSNAQNVWLPLEHTPSLAGFPTSAMMDDGNGGEYRKTFHAYAPPFAQLVESPTTIAGVAMQIDTWHREKMNISGGSPFVSGPVPRASLAPTRGPDAIYSGLLECPITTRIRKIPDGSASAGFNSSYAAQTFQCAKVAPRRCDTAVAGAAACFSAAAALNGLRGANLTMRVVHNARTPAGCAVTVDTSAAELYVQATYNSNVNSSVCCAARAPSGKSRGFAMALRNNTVQLALELDAAANSASTSGVATLTLVGPANLWFAVGFNATQMADAPYAIVIAGGGKVSERKLARHASGVLLPASPSLRVVSTTVRDGVRTVKLARSIVGASANHYTFPTDALSIPFIAAVGKSATFAPHGDAPHGTATLHLWPVASPVCVCSTPAAPFGEGSGTIVYAPTGENFGFNQRRRCPTQPRGDLIHQRNPTCDVRTYVGGMQVCKHGWHLLDADQDIPWLDQPLVYYKKFRVYFQEYVPKHHVNIERHDWGVGSGGNHDEYDVPQCARGTPVDKCTHTVTGTWIPIPASNQPTRLVALHHHCHAPTCLKIETWNNDTGELICRTRPVYGGTGGYVADEKRFDEPGYVAIPSCMWGNEEDGLAPPILMNGVTIHVVAVTNNTYGHHGEMALPQAMVAVG